MKKADLIKTWLPVALAAVLVALVFATGLGSRQKTWDNMVYNGLLSFERGDTATAGEGGEGYGVMNVGPGFNLAAGVYELEWYIGMNGNNRILLSSANNVQISPSEFVLTPENGFNRTQFTLPETAEKLQIQVLFEGGTEIEVYSVRLYTPMFRDHAFTFAFVAAALCALWIAHRRGALTPERRGELVVIGFAVLIASIPALKDNFTLGDDANFHMARIQNLADALMSGQIPARLGGFTYNGYGAITSVFYPDIFLYPSALMLAAGASIQHVMHLYDIALNVAAAWAMYVCVRRIFEDRHAATLASVLYTLAVYRLTDVYIRCALGEATAMSLLPLFVLGLWEVIFGDKSRWKMLALSAAGICMSHVLSTLLCGLFAAGVAMLFLVRIVRERRVWPLIKAAGAAAALCAFWLVPFMMYSRDGIGAAGIVRNIHDSAIAPAQLLLWNGISNAPWDHSLNAFPTEIGLPLLLGTAMAIYFFVTAKEDEGKNARHAMRFALGGIAVALLTTTLFPWSYVEALTNGLSNFIQFSWRFMMIVDVLLVIAASYGYARLARSNRDAVTFATLALCAVIALVPLGVHTRLDYYLEYGLGARTSIFQGEYQLPGTEVAKVSDKGWYAEGDVSVTDYEKSGARVTARVDAGEDARLSLPLFGFRGYAAEVDGQQMDWTLGDNNRLTVLLPAGTHGELRVWFEGERVWRVCDAVSLAALLALLACAGVKRRRMNAAQGKRQGK